jgi:hypothetical protein
MFEFLNSIFPFGAFVVLTIAIGLAYALIKESSIFIYEAAKELLYPTPKLSEEEASKIYKEASEFVHSKHRPWMYDDTFAEYLAIVYKMSEKRWNELYRNN